MVMQVESVRLTAPVNRIIPFSSVDGPGSRTAVFLQGCNINCRYCHNPETRNFCIGCGACVAVCPRHALTISHEILYDPSRCVFCDACIQVCPHGSSPRIRNLTPQETFCEIARQMPFIRGVTVSGGECMLHVRFLKELFTLCKQHGLHTLIDSNGTVPFAGQAELMEVTDGVMLDVKAWDRAQHEIVTGSGNETILANAVWLAQHGKLYEVRTVVVPGLFDAEETVRQTARLLAPLAKTRIRYKLITYRENGVRKEYRNYTPPTREEMERLGRIAEAEGICEVVVV